MNFDNFIIVKIKNDMQINNYLLGELLNLGVREQLENGVLLPLAIESGSVAIFHVVQFVLRVPSSKRFSVEDKFEDQF